MNLFFLNDGKSFNNWGIRSTSESLKKIFDKYSNEKIKYHYLPHKVFVQKYLFDPTIFGKKIFNRNSRLKPFLGDLIRVPNYADEFTDVLNYWTQSNLNSTEKKILETIKSVDMVVFNAEGSIYRSNKSALIGLFLLALSGKLGKKTLLCNCSFSLTNQDNILESYVKNSLQYIDHVFLRETKSYKVFRENFRYSSVKMVPDAVFHEKKIGNNEIIKNQFVVSSSMLPLGSYRYTPHPIEVLINDLKIRFGLDPIILSIDTEDKYLRDIAIKNNWKLLNHKAPIKTVRLEIARSKFMLSGRYHHLIYSLIENVPIIPLNTTSQKIHGLIEMINTNQYVFDPLNLTKESDIIIKEVKKTLKNRQKISNFYNHQVSEIRSLLNAYSKI